MRTTSRSQRSSHASGRCVVRVCTQHRTSGISVLRMDKHTAPLSNTLMCRKPCGASRAQGGGGTTREEWLRPTPDVEPKHSCVTQLHLGHVGGGRPGREVSAQGKQASSKATLPPTEGRPACCDVQPPAATPAPPPPRLPGGVPQRRVQPPAFATPASLLLQSLLGEGQRHGDLGALKVRLVLAGHDALPVEEVRAAVVLGLGLGCAGVREAARCPRPRVVREPQGAERLRHVLMASPRRRCAVHAASCCFGGAARATAWGATRGALRPARPASCQGRR